MKREILMTLTACCLQGTPTASVAQTIIDEVTVIELKRAGRALQPAVEIDRATINETAPVTMTDILRRLPSVGIRTNSRGEAVLRLRGSEERQTGIFLDGAPLSVPWDGRVDLSALPAGIVDQVSVTASASPFEYGANSTLGVLEIRTPVNIQPGLLHVQAELGSQDSALLSTVAGSAAGPVDWLFGGSFRKLGGEAVSSRSVIPYGPTRDGARVNTDLESASLFIAASTPLDWGAVRASLFSVGAERGIANAGHIDPAIGSPRYWRYPHWRFNQLTVNSAAELGDSLSLRSTVWLQHFEQTIDQYTDGSYSIVESSEDDTDKTLGLRLVLDRPFGAFNVRVVGNAQITTHEQVDTDHLGNVRGPLQRFQQDLYSLGAEFDLAPGDESLLSAGFSYNLAATPETGGRGSQDDLGSWASSIAARWYPSAQWEVAASVGRRTRFPTLRELYGESLGQFVLNPDLKPETALLADLTFQRESRDKRVALRLTPWLQRIDDTLSRRTIEVGDVRFRQRYNLKGSRGYGFEAGIEWRIRDDLELRLNGNWQDHEARLENDGKRPVLYLRPRAQISLALDYVVDRNWDLFLEMQHVGTALDEDEDGSVVRLPTSTEINLRLFRTLRHDDDGRWRAYASIDNLSNDVILPQLGLPLPGRTLSFGVRFERL